MISSSVSRPSFRRSGWRGPGVGAILRWAVLAGLLFGPWLALLISTGAAVARGNVDWLLLALPTGRRLSLLLRSVGMCAAVAAIDLAVGVLIACAVWSSRRRWAWARWLPLALAALPPYIHALAWSEVLGRLSVMGRGGRLSGVWISVWTMAMALLPLAIGLALISLQTVARPLVDAARTRHDDLTVLWRVILPLAAPLLGAGGGLIFLLSLMDYTVPSLFGVNVYALEIFAEFSASYEPARAFLLSVPLLAIAAGVLWVGQTVLRNAAQEPVWGVSPWGTPPHWSRGFLLGQRAALLVWALQAAVPLVVLAGLTVSSGAWWTTLGPAGREIALSFGIAVAAALIGLPLGWMAMNTLASGVQPSGAVGWAFFLPVALPAPLVGIGLVALWNRAGAGGVYGTAWMPVLAALARFAPLAALALIAQYRRVDPLLWDAARVFQVRDWQTTRRVRVPLLAPGLAAGASLVFALTLGELGATLIVAPPGQTTLTLRIYNYLHYGGSDVVAGLCLVMLLLTLAAGVLGAYAMGAWSRRNSLGEIR